MNARELFDLCAMNGCDDCPYKDDEKTCEVVIDAINRLRWPEWYTKGNQLLKFASGDSIKPSQAMRGGHE